MGKLTATVEVGSRLIRALVLACLLSIASGLAVPGAAAAAGPRARSFDYFIHSRIEAKDGLPAQANSMVQTPDGYMWFGTPDGLFRYNGQTFERVAVDGRGGFANPSIIEAIVTRKGEIWVALGQSSGVAVVRGGVLRQTGLPSPPRQITHLVDGPDDMIWAASSGKDKRLFRFSGGRWKQMDILLGMPPGAVADMESDRRGTIWFSLADPSGRGRLAYLQAGADRIEVAPDRLGLGRLALDPNGGLWVSDNLGTRMLRDAGGRPPARAIAYPPVPHIVFPRIRFDRSGAIWGAAMSGGIFLIPDATNVANSGTSPQTFHERDRAGTVATLDVFADRESNVWVSSSEALHRFHPANAVPVAGIASDPRAPQRVAAAADGSVYLFSLGRLYRARPGEPPRPVASGLDDSAAMCAARSGGVWLLQGTGTLLFDGRQRRRFPDRPAGELPTMCEEDGFGRLWAIAPDAVAWLQDNRWHAGFPGLGPGEVWDVATDAAGALMLHLESNKLIRIDATRARQLAGWPGAISAMRLTPTGLLVSHAAGLWRAPGDGQPAAATLARPLAKLRDFDLRDGYLWAFGVNGVERIPVGDLERLWNGRGTPAGIMTFDWSEGLPVGKQDIRIKGRQIVAGSDGRIWVLTRAGPYVIDSGNIVRNVIPPPLAVRAVWAEGRREGSLDQALEFPGGTRSVRIAYSGLSYSLPERVRFKYRLVGLSDDWTYAGNRHEVTFGNLGPGSYRFEVAGANEDGVWNDKPAAIDFTIAPTFVQSMWFKLGVALLLLTAAVIVYRWRTYSLTMRVRNAMSERSAERDRIARELHDTLLQSVQALILRFQLLIDHLPEGHRSRVDLSTALDQADEVLAESRRRVLDLRARHPRSDLKSVIGALAARQLPASRIQTEVSTSGQVRPIDCLVFNGLIDVANEALFNVLRHAGANRVRVEIRYGQANLEMEIADNGVGLDAESIRAAASGGHFGVVGMQERIANIGGKFCLDSAPGNGTSITVRVPSSIAYRARDEQTPEKSGGGGAWCARQALEPARR